MGHVGSSIGMLFEALAWKSWLQLMKTVVHAGCIIIGNPRVFIWLLSWVFWYLSLLTQTIIKNTMPLSYLIYEPRYIHYYSFFFLFKFQFKSCKFCAAQDLCLNQQINNWFVSNSVFLANFLELNQYYLHHIHWHCFTLSCDM